MPYMIQKNGDLFCVHLQNDDKTTGEKIKCHSSMQEAKDHMAALYAAMQDESMKAADNLFDLEHVTVKAVGDWELEIRAVPFGIDRDEQSFDAQTDYMLAEFPTPVITYHHGVNPGAKGLQANPMIIGKTTSVEKRADGIWIRVLLDKTLDFARRVWEAAKKGLAVASSDSIAHLARLEVNGKQIFYDKDRPGRIAVWPLAGVSLWDLGNGNFRPASPNAIALPAMKAIYREAGLPFPDFNPHDVLPDAAHATAGKRTREQALAYLITIPNEE